MFAFDSFYLNLNYVAQTDYEEQDFYNNLWSCIKINLFNYFNILHNFR